MVRRLVLIDLLGHQQGVGAQDHVLLAGDEALDDPRHVLVQQRLAAGDRNGGRAALVDRGHASLVAQPLVQDLVGIVDLAAAGAGQVAAEQGLQHQHQRIAFAAREMLADDVGADASSPGQGNAHAPLPSCAAGRAGRRFRAAPEAGGRRWFPPRPASGATSTGSISRRAAMTSMTSSSGAEAPAVRPTVLTPFSHAGSSSPASGIR